MSTGAEIEQALARAIAFLERTQLPSGEFRVYAERPGHREIDPSIFPTAVAAHAISFAPAAQAMRERAVDYLASEMDPRGLWKHWPRSHPHHRELPPDLDDTSCASDALRRSGRSFPENRALLLANRNRRGLFRTWKLMAAELRHPIVLLGFFRMTSAKPFDVDAVVNANVLHYLGHSVDTQPVVDHLLAVLRAGNESVCDKWYENPFAIWYFFSRALHRVAPGAGTIIMERVKRTTARSALDHALAACTLHYWGHRPDVDALLAAQLPSGAWPAAALYHGGRKRTGPASFAPPHPDTPSWGSEELTTAFCIEALARMQETK